MISTLPERQTWIHQAAQVEDHDRAKNALLAACLLGALDHFGKADMERHQLANRMDATVTHLRQVFQRGDRGLHGCGFEYAVHAAVNDAPEIPADIRGATVAALTEAVVRKYDELGIDTLGWSRGGLRSVMFGVERSWRFDRVIAEVGPDAMFWSRRGADPYSIADVMPFTVCRGFSVAGKRRANDRQVPDDLTHLFKTDLFLGGKVAVFGNAPSATAWLSASVKYRARSLETGPGLHLGVETSWRPMPATYATRVDAVTSHRRKDDMHVVTLPLDGEFVHTFNSAYMALREFCTKTLLTKHPHPTEQPDRYFRRLAAFLYDHRDLRVVDVAEVLRTLGQPDVVEAFHPAETAPEQGDRMRLVPVPHQDAA